MRLLFISNDFPNPLNPTGAIFNLQLTRALSRRHQVEVVAPVSWVDEFNAWRTGQAKLPPGRWMNFQGVAVHYPRYYYPPKFLRAYYGWFYWQSVRATVERLIATAAAKGASFDAVLAYWVHPDGEVAVRAARRIGVASAVIVGGSDVQVITSDPRRRQCVVNVLRSIDAVITVNQDLKRKVEAMGISPRKIHAWSQGLDSSIFFPGDRAQARRRLGVAEQGPLLLWVGRLVPVKGLEVLLDACALLRQAGTSFTAYLVGDGPLRQALEEKSAVKGLQNVVKFVGACPPEQLGDWYRAADLFVMSSWSEGLPNVLRESLACGTPFVASRVGGIAEIAGGSDRLFPAGDAAAMAQAVGQSLAESTGQPIVPANAPPTWDQAAESLTALICPRGKTAPIVAGHRMATAGKARSGVSGFNQILRRVLTWTIPRRFMVFRGPAAGGKVCLTFDDGPDPLRTPVVLDILERFNAKATFFVIGQKSAQHPDVIRRILAEGHALGHHSFSHSPPEGTSAWQLIREIGQTDEVLRYSVPNGLKLCRPPFGKITVRKCFALWSKGLTIVLWNQDSKDYAAESATELRKNLLNFRPCAGDIVLLHDRIPATAAVLPELIATIRNAGLGFATVDDWFPQRAAAPVIPPRGVQAVYGSSQPEH